MVKAKLNNLIHSSEKIYKFRRNYIMAPIRKIASFTPWYNEYLNNKYLEQVRQTLKEWANGAQVLEVGCGPGHLSESFRKNFAAKSYAGVDYSFGMVVDAKRSYPDELFLRGDAINIPFLDKSFDIVYSAYLFHHLKPELRKKAILEQLRVAKRAVIIEEAFGFASGFWRQPYWLYYTLADCSYYRYTSQEWLSMIKSLNKKLLCNYVTDEQWILSRLLFLIVEP